MSAVPAWAPRLRTEVEVSADSVWELFEQGLLKKEPLIVRRAAKAAGLLVDDLRLASIRRERRGFVKPAHEDTKPEPGLPVRPTLEALRIRENQVGKRLSERNNPEPGMRICSLCRETKPIAAFGWKERQNGRLHSQCADCRRQRARERYLDVKKARIVNEVLLAFELHEGDEAVGVPCPVCAEALAIGDHVEGNTRLVHARCGSGDE